MSFQPKSDDFVVTVRDESVPRSEVVEMLLQLSSARLTARDLIAERVRAECDERLRARKGDTATRLVIPGKKEKALNTGQVARSVVPEKQISIALEAFEANGFILLVDDLQVETLDEEIAVEEDTVVTFLKLTPLVGG